MNTSQLATREDLKKLATTTEVEEIKINVKSLETKIDKLQNTLDAFVGIVDDLRTENTIGTHQTHELQKKVGNLEKRVTIIERSKHIH